MSELKGQDSKNMIEQLEKLNQILEAGNYQDPQVELSPTLEVADRTSLAQKYLSEKAKEAFNGKTSKTLFVVENGVAVAKAVFFCVRTRKENQEKGVKIMAEIANDLAEKGYLHSILSPISSMALAKMPLEVLQTVQFFFPMVPLDKVEEVKQNIYSVEEGGIGICVDSLEYDLAPGEFMAEAYIGHHYDHNGLLSKEYFDVEGQLFNTVNQFLSVLPSGTKFLGANNCAVVSLAKPYELKFFNPLLKDVKKVELEYVRSVVKTDNTKIEQFNLLTGVRYLYRDGTTVPASLDKVIP